MSYDEALKDLEVGEQTPDGVIKLNGNVLCAVCGKETQYADIDFLCGVCSSDCSMALWEEFTAALYDGRKPSRKPR